VLSSAHKINQASIAYEKALEHCADESSRAMVSFFFAGHLSRKAYDPKRALVLARKAHRQLSLPDTSILLGNLLDWNRRFKEGQQYLGEALDRASGRQRLIVLTALVDSWRRWSEKTLADDRRPADAAQRAYDGFVLGTDEIESGTLDDRLADSVVECALAYVRCCLVRTADTGRRVGALLEIASRISQRPNVYRFAAAGHTSLLS
jgi:hypothetical protein